MIATETHILILQEFFDHEFWREPRQFSHFEAYLDLVEQAFRPDRNELWLFERPTGELVVMVRAFAKRWKWIEQRVESFLEQLDDAGEIEIRPENGRRVLRFHNQVHQELVVKAISSVGSAAAQKSPNHE